MKKAVLVLALAVLAVMQSAVYWNVHLLYQAKEGAAGAQDRARVLERAARIYPWNDDVEFELGKAAFERAAESLGTAPERDVALGASVRHFSRALRLNPGSAAGHVHLAQSLQYMSYLGLPVPAAYFDEYKKAASLTGHNSQIYGETGKVLLAGWESLRPEEKGFALEILKKTLAGKNETRLLQILEIWNLHGRDYAAIEQTLPEDPGIMRAYAGFLGDKGLSLDVRQRALARAELLDFQDARNELDQGQRKFEYLETEEAAARGSSCLKRLGSIVFYQDLIREELISPQEYAQVRKAAYLLLAKTQIDQTRTLADPDGFLAAYLALEDQPLAVGEFEKFLTERGLLSDGPDASSRPTDLRILALEMELDFKQNRYRDITRTGEMLEKSPLIIPDAGRLFYARILGLVGDSYMKLDYLYEAEKAYSEAISAGRDGLDDLFRLERCYARLNDEVKLVGIRQRICTLLTPSVTAMGRRPLEKGEPVELPLFCDGQPLTLTVTFENPAPGSRPLLRALFNGRVVHEGYAEGGALTIPVTPIPGANTLVLESASGTVTLIKLEHSAAVRPAGPGR
ncbi:MAG: hypothetical protein ABSG19_04395 [Candidatus Aminicenantales bacterium]